MYTSFIGKKFLRLYNEREKKQYTAHQFFDEVLFILFFKSDKDLMFVHNSKFSNASLSSKSSDEKLALFHKAVKEDEANSSTMVGYAAKGFKEVTSGQLTNLPNSIDSEDVYASWIGEALAVGIEGGLYLLFEREDLLWDIFQGWAMYRKFLQQTPSVKGRQIEYWNGHWLKYQLGERDENFDPPRPEKGVSGNELVLKGVSWVQLIFKLSQRYPSVSLTTYSYALGQMNTTIGFINLQLPEITRFWEWQDLLFAKNDTLGRKQIEKLYEPLLTFRAACRSSGVIGLKAIEPSKLRDYFPQLNGKNKDYKLSTDESFFYFNLYKLWIIAMLNKKELLVLASKTADSLLAIEGKETRTAKLSSLSENIRNAKNTREFIDKLREVLDKDDTNAETLREVMQEVLTMPNDNFPLFVTLIRFEHTYKKIIAQKAVS